MSGRGGPKRKGGPPRGRPGPRRPDRRSGNKGQPPGRQTGRSSGPKGLGGEQIEGRHAVRELLAVGARPVHELWMADDLDESPVVAEILDLAADRRLAVTHVSRKKLEAEAATEAPQGVLARARPLQATELDEVLGLDRPFLMVLDGITDPGNLGALLRTADCAGVDGVVLPRHRAVRITPTVAKAAAGSIEHLRLVQVGGVPAALAQMSERGVWTVGLDGTARDQLFDLTVATEPVAVVLGAEGRGLSRLASERCDQLVSIPLLGATESLNVAAAGALALYEIVRRRVGH